jgi:Cu(I)/Ag(I) efflux system membrane fusion protein
MRARTLVIIAVAILTIGAGATWYAVNRHGLRQTTAAPVPEPEVWTCTMHPEVREHMPGQCPKCGMDLVRAEGTKTPAAERTTPPDAAASPNRAAVELDTRRRQLLGVRTARAERGAITRDIRAVGIVRFDETRLADINLKLDGWIKKLYVETTGQGVGRGQPLLDLYSPELLAAQEEFLLALSTRDTMRNSQVEDARVQSERLVDSARQRMMLWDLPP